jgi:hypothetical protein
MPPKAKSKHKTQDIHERWKNQHLLEMAMSSGKGIRTQVNNRRVSVLFPIAAQHWELPSRMASIIRFFLFLGVLSRFYLIWVCWKFGMTQMDVANWAVTALFRSSNSFFFVFCEVTQIVERELTWKRGWGGGEEQNSSELSQTLHYSNALQQHELSQQM